MNLGWTLLNDSSDHATFRASENNTENWRPMLTVVYSPEPPTFALSSIGLLALAYFGRRRNRAPQTP